jgi:hypothetical protein
LDLDASCNEKGHNLFLDPTLCLLILIIIKCSKLVMIEAQTLLNFDALTCFIDKELVPQCKLIIMEKNTSLLVEVINGLNFS